MMYKGKNFLIDSAFGESRFSPQITQIVTDYLFIRMSWGGE